MTDTFLSAFAAHCPVLEVSVFFFFSRSLPPCLPPSPVTYYCKNNQQITITQELWLDNCNKLTNESIMKVSQYCSLKVLKLSGVYKLTGKPKNENKPIRKRQENENENEMTARNQTKPDGTNTQQTLSHTF